MNYFCSYGAGWSQHRFELCVVWEFIFSSLSFFSYKMGVFVRPKWDDVNERTLANAYVHKYLLLLRCCCVWLGHLTSLFPLIPWHLYSKRLFESFYLLMSHCYFFNICEHKLNVRFCAGFSDKSIKMKLSGAFLLPHFYSRRLISFNGSLYKRCFPKVYYVCCFIISSLSGRF